MIRRNKLVAPDGIPGAILKFGGEALIRYLVRLLDITVNNDTIPRDWKETIVNDDTIPRDWEKAVVNNDTIPRDWKKSRS
jgi:hypothetical protein